MTDTALLFGNHPRTQDAHVKWLQTDDGKRLRYAYWEGGARGTVTIFNGRTEFIEKYLDLVDYFLALGFSVTCHDWRGQGLSERNSFRPHRNHIFDFSEYQRDASRVLNEVNLLPKPYIMYAHSMGGEIARRALFGLHEHSAAIFSAPMFGIKTPALLTPFRGGIIEFYRKLSKMWAVAPTTKDAVYETYTSFEKNDLTNSRTRYEAHAEFMRQNPEIGAYGPTIYWLDAAYREMEALGREAMPSLPSLVFVGTKENVVSKKEIEQVALQHQNVQLVTIEGAKHEIYMDEGETLATHDLEIEAFLKSLDI